MLLGVETVEGDLMTSHGYNQHFPQLCRLSLSPTSHLMYWDYEKRRAPKAAPGATRKAYGTTWRGKQWLQALKDIDYSNRLPRGKTYANKGLAYAWICTSIRSRQKSSARNPSHIASKYRYQLSTKRPANACCMSLQRIRYFSPNSSIGSFPLN